MCIRDRYQRRVRDRLLQLMAEQPLGVPFRWTYGSSPFFSTAASGLPQKHGMSQWYAREAWPAAAMERYEMGAPWDRTTPVSYTHLRAHETPEHLVCRLLLEKKKKNRFFPYLISVIH
eukprot:TRINITY_DN16220_c0_g1_i5.p1 TRINITY_DN16220_c0_g1~~TRINITY_DN16220_c0_g1_i5.p1  ORF type:complete len:118 (+),score=32.66 TRINITY_DN16220_c0_g1_i5:120-473(+)